MKYQVLVKASKQYTSTSQFFMVDAESESTAIRIAMDKMRRSYHRGEIITVESVKRLS